MSEIEAAIARFGDKYTRRVFSDGEVADSQNHPVGFATALATRFAAKEAVLKILKPDDHIPSWRMIEIRDRENGSREVVLSAYAAELAIARGVSDMSLSVSCGGGMAVAAAIGQVATSNIKTES